MQLHWKNHVKEDRLLLQPSKQKQRGNEQWLNNLSCTIKKWTLTSNGMAVTYSTFIADDMMKSALTALQFTKKIKSRGQQHKLEKSYSNILKKWQVTDMTKTQKQTFEKYIQLIDERVKWTLTFIDKYDSENDYTTSSARRMAGMQELEAIQTVAIYTLNNNELKDAICEYAHSKWREVMDYRSQN